MLNRRMRTRMSGGVSGGAGDDPAYSIGMPAMRMFADVDMLYGEEKSVGL